MRENLISRSVPIYRPTPSKDDFEPEPELAKAEYQYILSVIRSLSLLIDRNPTSFVIIGECKFWPYFFAARTSLWQFTQLTVSWL